MKLLRTNSENQDFIQLVKMLDEYLAYIDGDDHAFYDQFNKIENPESLTQEWFKDIINEYLHPGVKKKKSSFLARMFLASPSRLFEYTSTQKQC